MKKTLFVLVTLLCVVSTASAFAVGSSKAAAAKPATHGQHARGTIATVDEGAKSFVLNEGKSTTTIYWTDATKVTGGTVKPQEKAEVRWMARDGKNVATSVKIASK